MAPNYKLSYFEFRGFAEPARFLLKYGNIEFEDHRIKQEEWSKVKETTPFGQLPILEHEDKVGHQTIAICRYLGKIVKLAGSDDWEDLEIDAVVDTIDDLRMKIAAAYWEQNEEKKKILAATTLKETVPFYLTRLDELVQKNNGYLALGWLTWADLYFVSMSKSYDNFMGSNPLEKYSNLKTLKEKVEALPGIKEWIEVRPKTQY